MPVHTKSVYDAPDPADGLRVLTTAYWPRGIAKAKVDLYKRLLGPTRELLRAFKDDAINWSAYEAAYITLMSGDDQRAEISALAATAHEQTVTIMCMCNDESRCHRVTLRHLIEQAMEAAA
jgi:uncharacterized protein YeaO (DUF488 family)